MNLTTDVLVVGAGPVGLTASILLSRLGISHEIIESRSGLHEAPQAHVVSSRTMEILTRACEIPDHELRSAATPFDQIPVVRWVDTLAGIEHGHISLVTPERVTKMFASTPCPPANIAQHRLEPVLHSAVTAAGVKVRFGHEWASADEIDGGARSTIRDRTTGETTEVTSNFVIACDGASSTVRRSSGIAMEGPSVVDSFTNVHLRVDLRPVIAERPGLLFWCIGGPVEACFIVHDIGEECVLMLQGDDAATLSETELSAVVLEAIGTNIDFEIVSVNPWHMSSQVAQTFRSGRIFLAGDAAHRFPPTGGIGMNTGIADVHNLCWKLDEVLNDRADGSLLDSYEGERRPVAVANAAQSLDNHLKMADVEDAVAAASGIADAIQGQEEHFDMAGLDLGFRYLSDAVIDDGSASPEVENPVTDVPHTTKPGYRLSHAELVVDERPQSTIDLADYQSYVLAVGKDIDHGISAIVPVAHAGHLDEDEVVLIRPDGHVAWRLKGAHHDPAMRATSVLEQLRGKAQ